MPPFNPIQTNFTAGEVSPRMKGRVDIARYANALQVCRNFIGQSQGSLYRRSGTRFICPVKTQSAKTRLVEFEFSTTQAYVIEFGNLYCRFFKDYGIITEATQVITGATNATPIVITIAGHGYSNGDSVAISGVLGNHAANGNWVVAGVTANTFELTSSVGNGAYTSGGTAGKIVELTTTYLTADIPNLFFTQSADTLYITAQGYPPRKLTRSSHTAWTITTISFQDGPYMSENTTATTFTSAAATGVGVNVTASAVTGINNNTGFQTTDVGRLIRIRNGTAVGWATITSRTSTTVVVVTINSTVPTAAVTTWRLGSFSDTTGYPACSTFHQERFCLAGTTSQPQTVWMSESGLYENFAPTDSAAAVQDDSGVTYTIVSKKVNSIFWMESGPVLLIGTQGQEWQVKAGSISQPITPTNIEVTPQTSYGSKRLRPVKVGTATLFIQRSGRKIRELLYNFQIDGFEAKDLSLLSEHMLRQGDYIVDVAYQQEPDGIIWLVRNDGRLIGMSYLPDQQIVGFFEMRLGGAFSTGEAVVESVAVIPSSDGTTDVLHLIVKRTINAATTRYVEYVEVPFETEDEDDKDDAFFVDSGLSYSGSAATIFSNLGHLEGQTVKILADGAVRPSAVVANGRITLATSATDVHIGLGFRSIIKTLPVEGGAAYGTAQGKIKRTSRVNVRVLNTLGMKYGVTDADADLSVATFRETSDLMDASPPLFTGDVPLELDDTYTKEGTYVIVQDDPLPMTILALMPETVVFK